MKKAFLTICLMVLMSYSYSQSQPQDLLYNLHISFESNGNYAVINTQQPDNLWQKGTPSKTFFNSAYSIPYAIVTDTIHPYVSGNLSSFTVPCRYSGCWGTGLLSFEHKYQTDSLHAGCYVEIAYDTSTTFHNIIYDTVQTFTIGLGLNNFYTKKDTMIGGIPAFQGNSKTWRNPSVFWIWEIGVRDYFDHDSITLKFNFKSNADATPEEGWMIDDIDFSLFDCTGGIRELEPSHPFAEILPNPFHGNATLHMSNFGKGTFRISIFNSIGVKVKETEINSFPDFPLEARTLHPGIYFYRIDGKIPTPVTGKFIIIE